MANPSPNVGPQTTLKGVSDIGRALIKSQVEANAVEFLKWGCLGIGAFYNFYLPASGAYGGSFTTLRNIDDPNYQAWQAWEGPRQDWVWESGVQYSTQPIAISGVYVNGTFYQNNSLVPTGSGFHINYPLGRVWFDNPLPPSSVVECEYSARSWQFSPASVPWWRQVQFNSLRPDDFQYANYGSGAWAIMAENRVQLPHVIVDATPRQTFIPLGLGGGTRLNQEVLFHILAEVPQDPKLMSDVIIAQRERTIYLFDLNKIAESGAFPLDENGGIAPRALCYPDLVAPPEQGGYFFEKASLLEMSSDYVSNAPPLYHSIVRCTIQVDMPW